MSSDLNYAERRLAVVACDDSDRDPDHENCRLAWNLAHPDDQVTAVEQRAFEDRALAGWMHGLAEDRGEGN